MFFTFKVAASDKSIRQLLTLAAQKRMKFFFNLFIYFIYFWLCWVLLHACFLQLWRVGATLRCGLWASHCVGFSCCGARALGTRASVVGGSRALERRLSNCGARASLLHGMWELPGPGLEPLSPALAGGFLTTAPPGKPKRMKFTHL